MSYDEYDKFVCHNSCSWHNHSQSCGYANSWFALFWVKDADYGNQLLVDAKSFTVEHTSTPVLYLISSTSNADDNDLETEKSYQNGCDIIATPRVHDDKVTFTLESRIRGQQQPCDM